VLSRNSIKSLAVDFVAQNAYHLGESYTNKKQQALNAFKMLRKWSLVWPFKKMPV
jgi:hypothetical protein